MTQTGTTTMSMAAERWGHCPTPGRRPCRAFLGGSSDGRTAAGQLARPPQVDGTRGKVAPMTATAQTECVPSSMPGILSPWKITAKGAPTARRLLTQPQILDCDLPRQTIGT